MPLSDEQMQPDPFAVAGDALVRGFIYQPLFLSEAEEATLIDEIRELPLKEAEYKQFHAKRRIHSYGGSYDFSTNRLLEAEPIAPFLHPLRARIAAWASRSAQDFAQALVAEYAPVRSSVGIGT